MEEKDKKKEFADDGRVIADMSVDGMPGPLFWRRNAQARKARAEREPDVKLTPREYAGMILGIISSYLVFGLIVFGGFALFILFCIKVWFK
ncbi:MAG TPA: hypothetical protein GX720_00675 [Clostridiaceae bacterium]|nr:hypothetical protein [Clostridiaceae bacterium]